jgi:CRP-like cAMP-binding protein
MVPNPQACQGEALTMTIDVTTLIKAHDFFKGIDERRLSELTAMGRLLEFPAGAKVFEEFERAKDVYFVVDGQISLALCDASSCRQITVVGKGDLLGWSPLIGRLRLFDTAQTVTAVRALVFDGKELMEFCEKNPEFGFEMMRRVARVLADRLSATRMQLYKLGGMHLPEVRLESD